MAARGRRYQPRTAKTLGNDPEFLFFRPTPAAAGIHHFQPTDLRTVRKTSHTHCLQRSTSLWQGGSRRRLTVYRVSDAPGVRPLQSRFRRLSTSPAKVTAQARTAMIMNSCDSGSRSGVSRMFAKLYVQTEYMPSGKTPPPIKRVIGKRHAADQIAPYAEH